MGKLRLLLVGLALVCSILGAIAAVSAQGSATATRPAMPIPRPIRGEPTIPPAPGRNCTPSGAVATKTGSGDPSCGFQEATVPSVALTPAALAPNAGIRPGVAAIKPQNVPTDVSRPAITRSDVEQYVASLPALVAKGVTSRSTSQVADVTFAPIATVDARFQIHTQVAPTTLVCLATVKGNFTVSEPPQVDSAGRITSNSVPQTTLYLVFDARTGDLLQQIVGP